MSEPRNSPLSVFYTGESNIPRLEENLSCQDALEPVCGNSKSVRILKEFRHIYEERLRNIDEEASGEGMELKLKTLTSWVNDLGEQNLMLVETVEQLEREAADRVALLEERLKKSSHIALEYMSKLEEYDHQFLDVSEGRAPSVVLPIRTSSRLVQAQQTEEILKTRVGNLQNDISGLLELIRRARCEGTWDTNGLSFLEVTYEDIFASYPHQVSDNLETLGLMQTTVKMLQQKLVKALEDYHGRDHEVKLLREQVACQQTDIAFKDVQIKNFAEKIQELQSSNCSRPQEEIHDAGKSFVVDAAVITSMNNGELEITSCNQRTVGSGTEELEVSVLTKKLDDTNFHLQTILQENERLVKEIGVLTSDLKIKTDKIDALSQNLTHVDKSEVESRVTDLEVTYSRLERSFKAAWEASKVKSMNDLIYRQNALEEKNPGGVKSCTFDISEKMPWCTPDVIKDQERIREICDNIKMILHPQQHCIVKKGVSFASPTKEEYKLQVQELQKALKQAQNGAEVARKQIRKNITEAREIKSICDKVTNYYQQRRYPEKMKEVNMNENKLTYEMASPFFDPSYEQGDMLTVSDRRKKVVDLQKKLLLREKMSESQLKVIEDLQEELRELKRKNKVLQGEEKERKYRLHGDCECKFGEQLNDKIKEYEIKIHSLQCDLFLAEVMMYEKNKIIQTLVYKLHLASGMIHLDHKDMEDKRLASGDMEMNVDLDNQFVDISQRDLQVSEYEMGKQCGRMSVLTLKRCTLCNMLCNNNNAMPDLVEKLQMEIETLKSTVSANEKVIVDQREMLNIQQESLMMSQDEVKDLQNQLKKLEHYNEEESKQMQEQLVTISNLHHTLMTTKHQLEESQNRCSFENSFEEEQQQYKTLLSKCQDFESKLLETKDFLVYLFKQVLFIEQKMQKWDTQQANLINIIMTLFICIKDFCSKFLSREEEITILDDFNSCSEEQESCELPCELEIFPNNEFSDVKLVEKTVQTEMTNFIIDFNTQNSICGVNREPDVFKNMHLNELRKLLDEQTLQGRRTGKFNYGLPMSYRDAISYCNYMEHEINKLQDLLEDFQWQMSVIKSEMGGSTDISDSVLKVANLEMMLSETCENYKMASIDCYKYQEQLLNAAEREVAQQEEFTAKERYLLEKMYQVQVENLKYLDTYQKLNEEIDLLHLELNERDCQLQSTASSLQNLSSQSSVLQKELQKQETNVEKLEEQLLQNNIKLQQALSYLDEKNNLLQKLNKENRNILDRLRKLELELQSNVTTEKQTFLQEISNIKTNIQHLKKIQEKSCLEVREHWWWDDGWQLW